MMMRFHVCLLMCLAWACQVDRVAEQQFDCTGDRQCGDDFTCHVGVCVPGPVLDAGNPEPDPEPQPDAAEAGPPDLGDGGMSDAAPSADRDGDGVEDGVDNCPRVANDQHDLDADGIGDSCDDDRDGDGVNNSVDGCPNLPNPAQLDRNADGRSDACEVPCQAAGTPCSLRKATCTVAETCGAGFAIFEYEGTCGGVWCGDFAPMAIDVAGGRCGSEEVCKPDAQMPCAPVDRCADDVECTPEAEGALCRLEVEPERDARCVDGRCRAWDCMTTDCNELGPRRFSQRIGFGIDAERRGAIIQENPGLTWHTLGFEFGSEEPAAPVAGLVEAHRRCAELMVHDRTDWRLPTMHELFELATSGGSPFRQSLELFLRTSNLFLSRTVTDAEHVMAISLLDGVASPVPRDTAGQVLCVREEDPPAVGDLALRRRAFESWRDLGDAQDTYTGLLWSEALVRMSYADAVEFCAENGAELPSVKALVSLMTFNADPGQASPGFWLDWNGARFGPSLRQIWSRTSSAFGGEHMHVDFEFGYVTAANDASMLDVLCVQWPVEPK